LSSVDKFEKNKYMKKVSLLLVGACAWVVSSCGGSSQSTEVSILIDGSSTVFPITAGIAEYYSEEKPNVEVTVGVSGTGGGFRKFCVGETDINDASRPIKDKEAKVATENGIKYTQVTVAYDGLAVVVSKDNDFIDYMTVEELKKLWENSENNVTLWSEIRDGWPEEEIQLYGPGDASGTFDYFVEAIIGKEGSSRVDYNSSENDNVLVKGVADSKLALGYFGLAYYQENKDKLKLVPVDAGNGAIAPTLETVMDKSYAPLSRPIFMYVSDKAAAKTEVVDFVNYYIDNAAEVSKLVGYIPLPAEEYKAQKEAFSAFVAK
jgi:phosphate transport system substrate-binding protein